MTQEELTNRINAWLAIPMNRDTPYLIELNDLYYQITGIRVACKFCNYNAMKRVIRHYLDNPYSVNNQNLKLTTMAKQNQNKDSKYQFTTAASKETIVLHTDTGTRAVTADTLTDEDAEFILKNPGLKKAYGHNIEKKEADENEGAKNAKGKATSEAAKSKPKKAKDGTDTDDDDIETVTDSDGPVAETGTDAPTA